MAILKSDEKERTLGAGFKRRSDLFERITVKFSFVFSSKQIKYKSSNLCLLGHELPDLNEVLHHGKCQQLPPLSAIFQKMKGGGVIRREG